MKATIPHPLPFREPEVSILRQGGGVLLLRQELPLLSCERSLAHLFADRARQVPNRVLVAEPFAPGTWRTASYAEIFQRACGLAAGLLKRGLSAGDRILVVSGPGIEHAVVHFAAMLARIITVPISPAYALAQDRSRLRHVIALTRPAMIFADDTARFADALAEAALARVESLTGNAGGLAEVEQAAQSIDVDELLSQIQPETVFKLLLTSGSTGLPKAVIQTHGMSCASLAFEASLSTLPSGIRDEQIVLDWMPWSHVGGGITIFNNILFTGASLYLDQGRPVPGQFDATIENLKTFPQEVFACPPIAFAMLADAMDHDRELRSRFFSRLLYVKSGGAAMPDEVRRRFQDHAVAATGRPVPVLMGYGTTETHGVLSVNHPTTAASILGQPKPGVTVKLVPEGDGFQLRIKAASVTPGYFADEAATLEAFDEGGFFCTGDTVKLDEAEPEQGLIFTGRAGDRFKTAAGSWVAAAELRAAVLSALDGDVRECLIVGEGELTIGALLWADESPDQRERICARLREFNASAGGETRRIGRILFSKKPVSSALFERTEKGSLNRSLIIRNRASELRQLYSEVDGSDAHAIDLCQVAKV